MAERSPHRIWTDWQPADCASVSSTIPLAAAPSRASLLTGLYPHQADIGHMMEDDGVDGYTGDLNTDTLTIAEALGEAGYRAYMSGKWHLTRHVDGPKHNWPCQRGFDSFFGIITGACSYYHPSTLTRNNERIDTPPGEFFLTDAISDEAADQLRRHAETHPDTPFFQYVAYTAPHWPLHAHPEDIERYRGPVRPGLGYTPRRTPRAAHQDGSDPSELAADAA